MTEGRTKTDAKARREIPGGPRFDIQLAVKTENRPLSSVEIGYAMAELFIPAPVAYFQLLLQNQNNWMYS